MVWLIKSPLSPGSMMRHRVERSDLCLEVGPLAAEMR